MVVLTPSRMAFRRTRKSSDGYSWLTIILSGSGTVFAGIICMATFMTESLLAKIGMSLMFVLFGVVFLFSLRGILFSYEWELVIDDDCIRWGEAARPMRQNRVEFPRLKRLVHDKSDNKVLADVGSWRLVPLGDYILMSAQDQTEVVEYLRQKLPSLEVAT